MKNILNIVNYEPNKDFKVAIPNAIFLGFEYDSLKDSDMHQAKIIHLYYSIMLLTPMGLNYIPYITLSALCKISGVKSTSSALTTLRKRLSFLQEKNLIKIKENINNIGKNDLIEIEVLVNKELLENNFTLLTSEEIETFLKLDTYEGLIFLYYKRHINKKIGYAFTTMETISDELGLSKNTITKANNKLIELGIILKENPNFCTKNKITGQIRNSNNRYYLNLDNSIKEPIENNKEYNIEKEIEKPKINLYKNQYNEIPF